MKKFPNLSKVFAAIFGAGNNELVLDEKAGTVTMSNEQFEATENLAGEVVTLREQNATLKTDAETATANLKKFKSSIGVAEDATEEQVATRITELKAMPGSKGAESGKKEEEETNTDPKAAETQAAIDAMPHNQAADGLSV
jgi:ABC-type uncharacterized transport system ATPase subunit